MDFLNLICHSSFQNQNNRKATHEFAPKLLILMLQKEFLKFNDICESWSSSKFDLTNILNLEYQSFGNVGQSH